MTELILNETPPSVNHYKGIKIMKSKTGKYFPMFYLTTKAKAFKKLCAESYKGPLYTERLRIDVQLFFKGKRKQDVDNFTKTIFDSLNGIAWQDDSQIKNMSVHIELDAKESKTIIKIESEI